MSVTNVSSLRKTFDQLGDKDDFIFYFIFNYFHSVPHNCLGTKYLILNTYSPYVVVSCHSVKYKYFGKLWKVNERWILLFFSLLFQIRGKTLKWLTLKYHFHVGVCYVHSTWTLRRLVCWRDVVLWSESAVSLVFFWKDLSDFLCVLMHSPF